MLGVMVLRNATSIDLIKNVGASFQSSFVQRSY